MKNDCEKRVEAYVDHISSFEKRKTLSPARHNPMGLLTHARSKETIVITELEVIGYMTSAGEQVRNEKLIKREDQMSKKYEKRYWPRKQRH